MSLWCMCSSLFRAEGAILMLAKITLSLLQIRSCLSLFLPVRAAQLTSLSSLIDGFSKEGMLCVVSKQTKLCSISSWIHPQCKEHVCRGDFWHLCGLGVDGVGTNRGRNTRTKQKRHQKPSGARLSQVAPEAVLLGCQQLMFQVFPAVLLVHSC